MFLGSRAGTQVGWKEGRILSRPQTTGQDTLAPAKVVVQGNILFGDVGEKLQHLLFLLLKGP